jgi:hypothetical protein
MKITTYSHTQPGIVVVVGLGVGAIGFLIAGVTVARPLLFTLVLFAVIAWLFYSLTIEIDDDELRWRFGPGLIHKRVKLADINSAKIVQTSVLEGWGIHYTRFGWLYNVSGFDGVAITLRTGKRFCLGTDEPEKLLIHLPRHSA